jgi:hypothetical protein
MEYAARHPWHRGRAGQTPASRTKGALVCRTPAAVLTRLPTPRGYSGARPNRQSSGPCPAAVRHLPGSISATASRWIRPPSGIPSRHDPGRDRAIRLAAMRRWPLHRSLHPWCRLRCGQVAERWRPRKTPALGRPGRKFGGRKAKLSRCRQSAAAGPAESQAARGCPVVLSNGRLAPSLST